MVHYTGFASDVSQFDCSLKRNKPLKFVVGQGKVISGLDEGPCVLLDFLCCRWREAERKDEWGIKSTGKLLGIRKQSVVTCSSLLTL